MPDLTDALSRAAGQPLPLNMPMVLERATQRRRRRRTAASALSVVAVGVIAAGALTLPHRPGHKATLITPATELPATKNQVQLADGCPAGWKVAQLEAGGVLLTLRTEGRNDDNLCLTLPNGRTVHPVRYGPRGGYGAYAGTFSDGAYFHTDSLGHVFVRLYPGNLSGVTVVLPDGDSTRVLGPFAGGNVVETSDPFVIDMGTNNCIPTCSGGLITHVLLTWSSEDRDYS